MKRILIVGEKNACRSQIAEGWMRYYTKKEAEVTSAGIEKGELDLHAANSMSNAIIDISKQYSKPVSDYLSKEFDYVIYTFTPKAGEELKFAGNPKIIVQEFALPKTEESSNATNANYDKLRDDIENFCFDFVHQNIRKMY